MIVVVLMVSPILHANAGNKAPKTDNVEEVHPLNEKGLVNSEKENGRNADEEKKLHVGYDNWPAIAGYFDGDGGLDVDVRKFTLHFVINFTDNWPPQLMQIKQFLESRGISVGTVRRTGIGGHKVEVASIESLRRCASAMLDGRSLFKKRKELKFMLDYFDGKITGDDVIGLLNEEVRNGVRVGKLRISKVPFTYTDGKRVYKKGHKWNSLGLLALSKERKEAVRKAYVEAGLTIYQLASRYEVSPSTIFRAIRGLQRGSGKMK